MAENSFTSSVARVSWHACDVHNQKSATSTQKNFILCVPWRASYPKKADCLKDDMTDSSNHQHMWDTGKLGKMYT